ncbi:MAG: rRNA maturation RNase YbeY [Sphingobacteriaceae bacterium]|jgi:rRNA maturation RNase YbeY|nr:MAG: rRNA maturation RNase YbeY [Pedobacter sp.]
MKKLPIYFFSEDTNYQPKEKIKVRNWLHQVILKEGYTLHTLNFIFCSDDYLLQINQDYLKHDTYTDIITFDNSTTEKEIISDIFISIDRVIDNAQKFKASRRDELHRVMVHGILHLLGYGDKKTTEKILMTCKEDEYLELRNF